jgi:hypothetical protein
LQKKIEYVSTRTLPQALSHDVRLYESDNIRCLKQSKGVGKYANIKKISNVGKNSTMIVSN